MRNCSPLHEFNLLKEKYIFYVFSCFVFLKRISRGTNVIKAELQDTETVTGKCIFKKKRKKVVINGRLCCLWLLNEKITVMLFDFLSQNTSLEIETSDSLSLWLDSGLVQSKRDEEEQEFLAILRSVRITSYSEPTPKSTVNITVEYETREKKASF